MRHTPLQEVKHIGCGCCSDIGRMLWKGKSLDVGFGGTWLVIELRDGRSVKMQYIGGREAEDGCEYVQDVEKKYGEHFEHAACITLHFDTPLHDETYEYNVDDGNWYLIAQGQGFA